MKYTALWPTNITMASQITGNLIVVQGLMQATHKNSNSTLNSLWLKVLVWTSQGASNAESECVSMSWRHHIVILSYLYIYIYNLWNIFIPSAQGRCWGRYNGFTLSVCLSVRPSHMPCPLCHTCSSGWILFICIRHKWSLALEGVSRIMTFDLGLYLQGNLATTLQQSC